MKRFYTLIALLFLTSCSGVKTNESEFSMNKNSTDSYTISEDSSYSTNTSDQVKEDTIIISFKDKYLINESSLCSCEIDDVNSINYELSDFLKIGYLNPSRICFSFNKYVKSVSVPKMNSFTGKITFGYANKNNIRFLFDCANDDYFYTYEFDSSNLHKNLLISSTSEILISQIIVKLC